MKNAVREMLSGHAVATMKRQGRTPVPEKVGWFDVGDDWVVFASPFPADEFQVHHLQVEAFEKNVDLVGLVCRDGGGERFLVDLEPVGISIWIEDEDIPKIKAEIDRFRAHLETSEGKETLAFMEACRDRMKENAEVG
jgi:hypothetical protein